MNANHKDFLNAMAEDAEDRDYQDQLRDCLMRFSTFMHDMPHEAQIDAFHDLRRFTNAMQKMRVALLQMTEPAGDHETDDMIRQVLARLEHYQMSAFVVVRGEIQAKMVDPAFLKWCSEIRAKERAEWRERVEQADQTLGDWKDAQDDSDPY